MKNRLNAFLDCSLDVLSLFFFQGKRSGDTVSCSTALVFEVWTPKLSFTVAARARIEEMLENI